MAREESLIFLCGHYEGIDERVLEEVVTDHISIGDYVLTGGELPAMVMIDAIAYYTMKTLRRQRVFKTACWNIPSIPGRPSGMERKCRKYYCPGTIKK